MKINPRRLDRIGVFASVGCAIHCLAAPLVLLMAPALGGVWAHPGTHLAIATLVLPVAGVALRRGVRGHGRRWVLWAGLAGMAFVFAGTLMPFLGSSAADAVSCGDCCPTLVVDEATGEHDVHVPLASAITMLGGAFLVAGHLGNLRCCARCKPA